MFHLPGFNFGYLVLTHSHLTMLADNLLKDCLAMIAMVHALLPGSCYASCLFQSPLFAWLILIYSSGGTFQLDQQAESKG